MSLSIRSNGENVDIYLCNNFNLIEMLVNTNTILTWRKEQIFLSMKELLIWTITSFTFPLLNKKPFSFDSTSSTTNKRTWRPNAKDALLISKVIVTNPPSSEVKVKNLQTVSLCIWKEKRPIYKISV